MLAGRERERAVVAALLDAARAGGGGALVVRLGNVFSKLQVSSRAELTALQLDQRSRPATRDGGNLAISPV